MTTEYADILGLDEGNEDSSVRNAFQTVVECAASDYPEKRHLAALSLAEALNTADGNEEQTKTLLHTIQQLANDSEVSVRRTVMHQLAIITNNCHEKLKLEKYFTNIVWPAVLKSCLDSDIEVRKVANPNLLTLARLQNLSVVDVDQLLKMIEVKVSPIQSEEMRVEVILLMADLAVIIDLKTTRLRLLPTFISLCSESAFAIRKSCAMSIGKICEAAEADYLETDLLPKFTVLCQDSVWGVRKACAESFVDIARHSCYDTRRGLLTRLIVGLLNDISRWVRASAYQALGPFIATFAQDREAGALVTPREKTTPQLVYESDNEASASVDAVFDDDVSQPDAHEAVGLCATLEILKETDGITAAESEDFAKSKGAIDSESGVADSSPSGSSVNFPAAVAEVADADRVSGSADAVTSDDANRSTEEALTTGKTAGDETEAETSTDDGCAFMESDESATITDRHVSLLARDGDADARNELGNDEEELIEAVTSESLLKPRDSDDGVAPTVSGANESAGDLQLAEKVSLSDKVSPEASSEDGAKQNCDIKDDEAVVGTLTRDDAEKKTETSDCESEDSQTKSKPAGKTDDDDVESKDNKTTVADSDNRDDGSTSDNESETFEDGKDSIVQSGSESTEIDTAAADALTSEEQGRHVHTVSETVISEPKQEIVQNIGSMRVEVTDELNVMDGFVQPVENLVKINVTHQNIVTLEQETIDPDDPEVEDITCRASVVRIPPETRTKPAGRPLLRRYRYHFSTLGTDEDDSDRDQMPDVETSSVELANQQLATSQSVVPCELLERYLNMTEPSLAQTVDSEILKHCAYSFPAVAYTLGQKNWTCLQDLYRFLSRNMQWQVRRTLALSIHELASVLGADLTVAELLPVFDELIKDLDEVRSGIVKNLSRFLQLLPNRIRICYLPKLEGFLITEVNARWRYRQEFAQQLVSLVELFSVSDVLSHILPLAFVLMSDRVSEVRQSSVLLVSAILKLLSEADRRVLLEVLGNVNQRLLDSGNWRQRQLFIFLSQSVLDDKTLSFGDFLELLLPNLLALREDPVPNVRITLSRLLSNVIMTHSDFGTSLVGVHENELLETLNMLKKDKDSDVRYFVTPMTGRLLSIV